MSNLKKSVIPLSLVDLGNRSGDSAQWKKTLQITEPIGTANLAIPVGSEIPAEIYGVAIEEGVSITLSGQARAVGECTRCLGPVERELSFSRTEIYYYPDQFQKLFSEEQETAADYDPHYQLFFPNEVDLEPLLIDAVVPQIPYTVLCREDCPGLCPDCGIRLAEAESDHHHEKIDPRWGALADFVAEQ